MAKKWNFKFGLPDKVELGILVFAVLCLIIFDYAQNIYQPISAGSPSNWSGLTWFGISALTTFWIFFVLYNLAIFWVYSRSLRQRLTSYRFDLIFGILSFLGIILLLSGAIGSLYFSAEEPISYMLGFKQIDIYHGGIFLQWISILYFSLTS